MRKKSKDIPGKRDRHLDIPAEANRDKHINFRELEDNDSENTDNPQETRMDNEKIQKRKEEWEKGIEEGKKQRNQH